MNFTLYIIAIIAGVVLAVYPKFTKTTTVQCPARLHFGLLSLAALAWGTLGFLLGANIPFQLLQEAQLEWAKTFAGGGAFGLAIALIFSKRFASNATS